MTTSYSFRDPDSQAREHMLRLPIDLELALRLEAALAKSPLKDQPTDTIMIQILSEFAISLSAAKSSPGNRVSMIALQSVDKIRSRRRR